MQFKGNLNFTSCPARPLGRQLVRYAETPDAPIPGKYQSLYKRSLWSWKLLHRYSGCERYLLDGKINVVTKALIPGKNQYRYGKKNIQPASEPGQN